MNIVFICDRNYLIPTRVTINSIIKNKGNNEKLCIYIIGVGLLIEDFDMFMHFKDESVIIEPIVPKENFEQILIEHWYVSKAALYKFLIPELIDADKILYLDSDIIVLGSLAKLYETDLGDMYAAVVRDMTAEVEYQFQLKHNIPYYFNSGMMLLNLKELREQGIAEKLIAIRKKDTSNLFMDQDTFNVAFNKKIMTVSPEYNFMLTNRADFHYSMEKIAEFYDLDLEEVKRIMERPVILHLTDKRKPWNSGDISEQYIWYQYVFEEDFPQIIQTIVSTWKTENELLKKRLICQKEVQELKILQCEENMLFYKNGMRFIIDNACLSGIMGKVWNIKEEISEYLENDDKPREILLYGAGRMGQAVFKCLWSLNKAKDVIGFAVSNKQDNAVELFGKNIYQWGEYKNRNVIVVIAIKSLPEEIIEEMFGSGFHNILDISKMFY